MMKQKLTSCAQLAVVIGSFIVLIAPFESIGAQESRRRRQTAGVVVGQGTQSSASIMPAVSAAASGSVAVPNVRVPVVGAQADTQAGGSAPPGNSAGSLAASGGATADDQEELPAQKEPRPGKGNNKGPPKNRRPAKQDDYGHEDDDEEEDQECYDDDEVGEYDYRPMFHGITRNPMRQFTRMMNSAFDQMNGAYDDYNTDYGRRSGSRTSASAISRGDGYSKAVSSITNNGRTRGLVSETRNGRTNTRRLGPKDDDDYAEDANYDA